MLTKVKVEPNHSQEPGTQYWYLMWVGYEILEQSLAAFQGMHEQEAELEAEWELNPGTSIWDVGILGSDLTAVSNAFP